MTYYIKTESIQKMLDHGDIITNAMTLNDEFNTSSYIEYEFPDHLAAELFRTGLLHHTRTREPWCDHERSILRESYLKGVDLTKIALSLDRSEGEIFKQLHFLFGPAGDLFEQTIESKN